MNVPKMLNWPVPILSLIFIVVVIAFWGALDGGVYWKNGYAEKIYAGLIVASIILLINSIFDFNNLRLTKIVSDSKLKGVLKDRTDDAYYAKLLKKAKSNVDIMGKTATRFLEDFGTVENDAERLIDELMGKGVKFRLLVCDTESDKAKRAYPYLKKYVSKGGSFEVKKFSKSDYNPQSLFIVDNECILGAMLSKQENKKIGSLHFNDKKSSYTKQFSDYFEDVWNNGEIHEKLDES